jgi:glycosyltransferase 2 family protein
VKLKLRFAIVALLGLGFAIYLVGHVGFGAVASAAADIGVGGFALVCLCYLALYPLLGLAWFIVLPRVSGARFWVCAWARMVREAAGDVLPFSQIGGLVLGARAAVLHRIPPPWAFASTVVDLTTELLAQIVYIALGLAILATHAPHTALFESVARYFVIGLVLAAAAGTTLLALQRFGHDLTLRLASRLLPGAVAHARAVGEALDAIYASRTRVALATAVHLAAWVASAAGTYIAFRLIGARVDFASVITIESLICAVRSAAVLVPNGLGVQEAAYALLAPLFGVGAPLGLAISLLKRARDVAAGVPILLLSQALEGRRLLAREDVGARGDVSE